MKCPECKPYYDHINGKQVKKPEMEEVGQIVTEHDDIMEPCYATLLQCPVCRAVKLQ